MTDTLLYQPVRDGYKFTPAYDVVETRLDGGLSRKRKDIQFGSHYVDLNWVLKNTEYTSFMGFFRSRLQDGTLPFFIELVTDIAVPTLHKCRCVGSLPILTSQRGLAYYVSARLEVEQNPTYTARMLFAWDGTDPIVQTLGAPTEDFALGLAPGDTIRIFDADCTHSPGNEFDFSGTYEVSAISGVAGTILTLDNPGAVNSDWTTLQGLVPDGAQKDVDTYATVTRVPT